MKHALIKNRRGQVIVEYVLLMVIAVAVAVLISNQLVSRDEESPGILVEKWHKILETIGNDLPDQKD